jgi:hypothetical protein
MFDADNFDIKTFKWLNSENASSSQDSNSKANKGKMWSSKRTQDSLTKSLDGIGIFSPQSRQDRNALAISDLKKSTEGLKIKQCDDEAEDDRDAQLERLQMRDWQEKTQFLLIKQLQDYLQ